MTVTKLSERASSKFSREEAAQIWIYRSTIYALTTAQTETEEGKFKFRTRGWKRFAANLCHN